MSLTENNPIDADWISPRERACETVYYLYANIKKKLEIESGKDFIKKNQTLIGQLVQSAIQEFSRNQTAIQQSDK